MTVPFDLDGAAAVLTGAGSGIGRATAISLAARGARIVASDVDASRAEETASLIAAGGGEADSLRVDVSDQQDLEALRDRCLERFGRLDLVMNNVGVLAMGPPEKLPVDAWQRVLDLNLLSIARSNLVFLPDLLAQGRGHVVNTSSASGLLAYGFDRLPYVASKHAVVGVSEALALLEQISVYGESTSPRAPQHPLVEPEVVGELVADAVTAGTFLVVTAPEIHDELRERAADPEAYLQAMIDDQDQSEG
jgi:NAD(P)-dependent dehydrogenase (short-subunit alcohol dehydrogenase family)